ncbi:hypothetical protein [Heliomicrobium modesticaldum]|nr:hypothetical protein [Heliomicrobium modesticaldum]
MRKTVMLLWQWRHLFFLLFFAVVATFFLDLALTVIRRSLVGEPVSLWTVFFAIFGLATGGYGFIRFVYRHDKKTGRVKKEMKWLE